MSETVKCSSCKKNLANTKGTARFPCPKCGEAEITRCKHCREIVVPYKCPKCGFIGPN
jgi:predicted RNA-binding Zn-ribbon protein involved in translation (DUF1610 family)